MKGKGSREKLTSGFAGGAALASKKFPYIIYLKQYITHFHRH